MEDKIKYLIALTHIKGIGFRKSRKILAKYKSAERFINLLLTNAPDIPISIKKICTPGDIRSALEYSEAQINFCKKNNVAILPYFAENYPYRLKHYDDSPLVLYSKGHADLNSPRTIGIVGTRKMTVYGKLSLEKIIPGFASVNATIISGLAYGVDTYAHKLSLAHNISTIGIMGTGINQVYPASNKKLARQMMEKGGIVTEFGAKTKPDAFNFPLRNRIIAALSDALVVIESRFKGGAMITADLAFNYNKDVFAIPGRTSDPYSAGTNELIKSQRAQLMESSGDLIRAMNWDSVTVPDAVQPTLFQNLNSEEKQLLELFEKNTPFHLEDVLQKIKQSHSDIAALLLNLQLKGIVKSLPGNRYLII